MVLKLHTLLKAVRRSLLLFSLLFLSLAVPLLAQPLAERVKEHRLSNGLKVLLVERHQAPIVALQIMFKAGGVNEHTGITGAAHMFEHMLFKGTKTLGTRDYARERLVLEKIDRLAEAIQQERRKGKAADPAKLRQLTKALEEAQAEARRYLVPDEIGKIYAQNGAVGFNAFTSKDYTQYVVNLPANRIELWMAIESDRLRNPVLREFYSERDVVLEERRRSYEVRPIGRLFEHFMATAFQAHPYRLPTIGWKSDIENLSKKVVEKFFRTYYIPNNAVIAIVGDIDPPGLLPKLERYFGSIPAGPPPPPVLTREPEQQGERRIEVLFDANPQLLIGYHKPAIWEEDDYVFDVISDLLSSGRTARLYRELVQKRGIAQFVSTFTVPGARYPNLFTIRAAPRQPHTVEELEAAIYTEIDRLKKEAVTPRELQKVLNRLDAQLLRSLDSNSGLARQLLYYEATAGTWRYLLTLREKIAQVTPDDILRVARTYLVKQNRTVAILHRGE
ncbi:MAG: insulinase family protein [Nitrospinota bacterium]|nr:MAG: insulinase family protein [Nitrospinota bacterium]